MIASDENGTINPGAQALLPLIPIPYVTSAEAGLGPRPARPERRAPGAAHRVRARARRLTRRHPRRLRHLPEPVGLQRPDRVRAQPAVLLHQAGRRPGRRPRPDAQTRDILDQRRDRHDRREHHGLRLQRRVQPDVERRPAVRAASRRRWSRSSYMGTWTLGADNATVRNVPGARARPDPGAPADPAVEPHQRDPLRRQVDLPRPHVQGRAAAARATSPTTSATRCRTRRTMRRARARPSRKRTCRRTCGTSSTRRGEWAHSSFDHRHQFVASGVYQLPFFSGAGGFTEACLGGWRVNAIFIAQSGAPFTVNLGVDRANIGAGPAQRPDQLRDPNLPGGERTPERWFDTSAFALPAPFTFGSAPRNSVIGPGFANVDFALAKTWALRRRSAARVPLGDLQPAQSRQLRSAEPHLRQRRTSAASSAPRARARCSSGCGSRSETGCWWLVAGG